MTEYFDWHPEEFEDLAPRKPNRFTYIRRRIVAGSAVLALLVAGCVGVSRGSRSMCSFSTETIDLPAPDDGDIKSLALQINGVTTNNCFQDAQDYIVTANISQVEDGIQKGELLAVPLSVQG